MAEIDKELLDELKNTWEGSFKEHHAQYEAEIAKFGEATAETKQALERANEHLDELDVRMQKLAEQVEAGNREREPSAAKQAFLNWARKGDARLSEDERKALVVADDPAAGFLAPDEFVQEIIKGEVLFSPLRRIARVRPTSAVAAKVPKRTGTFAATWTGESETRTESTGLKYGMEEVPNHELTAKVIVSNQDLEDSVFDIEAEINLEASEQFGVAEGAAFIAGNGVKKPEGVLANSDVDHVVSGSASAITADSILDLSSELKDAYVDGAYWIFRRKTLYALRKLKDSNDQYLWVPGFSAGIANASPALIDGMPYVQMPDMPEIAANAYPVALGNFKRGYMISDRIQMTAQRDPYTDADNGNVVFRFRKRTGGQVVLPEAIKLLKIAAS